MTLRPRAIAILCALRRGPRLSEDLQAAIGDEHWHQTAALIDEMDMDLIMPAGTKWQLAAAGLEWLAANLDAPR